MISDSHRRDLALYSVVLVALFTFPIPGLMAYAQPEEDGLTFLQLLFDNADGVILEAATDIAVTFDGGDVYMSYRDARGVAHFSRDVLSGELQQISILDTVTDREFESRRPVDLMVSASDRSLFVVLAADELESGRLARFHRDLVSGELTLSETLIDDVDGVVGLHNPFEIAQSADGRHVYVASLASDDGTPASIAAFTVDPQTGDASFSSVIFDDPLTDDGIDLLRDVVVSPDGRHIYLAGGDDLSIAVFSRNTSTGVLSFESSVDLSPSDRGVITPVPTTLFALSISADGRSLYAPVSGIDRLSVFDRDPVSGALRLSQELNTGDAGLEDFRFLWQAHVSPMGDRVYATTYGSFDFSDALTRIFVFERDLVTGALSLLEVIEDGVAGFDVMIWSFVSALTPDGANLYMSGYGLSDFRPSLTTFSAGVSLGTCGYVAQAQGQHDEFTSQVGISDDLDEDGLPDSASLALIEQVLCQPGFDSLVEATADAFMINRASAFFDRPSDAFPAPEHSEAIAALMMVGTDAQLALRTELSELTGRVLLNGYLVPLCDESGNCDVRLSGAGAARAPSADEVFSGFGDPDGDGVTNAEEYANTIARGGTVSEFAIAALDATLDGSEEIPVDAGDTSESGVCFIATAAYGTPLADEIGVLRTLRDSYLLESASGIAFVDSYYRVSQSLADIVAERALVRPMVRAALTPIVVIVGLALAFPVAEASVALTLVALIVFYLRRRHHRLIEH